MLHLFSINIFECLISKGSFSILSMSRGFISKIFLMQLVELSRIFKIALEDVFLRGTSIHRKRMPWSSRTLNFFFFFFESNTKTLLLIFLVIVTFLTSITLHITCFSFTFLIFIIFFEFRMSKQFSINILDLRMEVLLH